jgi:regulatory protein
LNRPARSASLVQPGEVPVAAGPRAMSPFDSGAMAPSDAREGAAAPRPDRALLRAAVAMLARRDFSRSELGRRLIRKSTEQAEPADAAAVERVLDHLQQKGLLSEDRFVRDFVRTRAERYGPIRMRHELLRRGVAEDRIESALGSQAGDEFSRAQALWARRFGVLPANPVQRARQGRFLASRGFSHGVIRRILGAPAFSREDPDPDC